MKNGKIEAPTEKQNETHEEKKGTKESELKNETKMTKEDKQRREEKRREKIDAGDGQKIKTEEDKDGSFYMKDILRKDHEERIEKRKENDNRKINKRSIFKTDLRTIACIVIITLIFPIINEESIVSNITLKIEGPGINDILKNR